MERQPRQPKKTQDCPNCGTSFTRYASQVTENSCCSKKCGLEWKAKRGLFRKKRGVTSNCQNCGKEVYVSQSQHKLGEGKFCSYTCADEAKRVFEREVAVCQNERCGKEFTRTINPDKPLRIFCSRACSNDSRIVRPLNWDHNGRPAKMDGNGYVMVWEPFHPNQAMHGWQYLHRIVAENKIGRFLLPSEAVHHIDEVRDNNDPDNLMVMDAKEHAVMSSKDWHERTRELWAAKREMEKKDRDLEAALARIAELEAHIF